MRYIISALLTSTAPLVLAPVVLAPTLLATAAQAEVPKVVTDIPPVHSIVAAVMGDLGQPVLLLDKGASEHHFQLRPSQAAQLSEAGLVVYVGPTLTPWLAAPLASLGNGAAQLELLAVPGTHLQDYGATSEDHDGHDHAEEAGHDDHDHDAEADQAGHADHDHEGHDDHEDHDHTGTDPHAWLDPANGKLWAGAVAAELARLDPEHAATYAANAAALTAAIDAADAAATATLTPVKDRPFAGFHDAYGYFAGHYGLAMAGAVSLGDATTPGAKHMADLKAKVSAGKILCLFPEAQHDPALLEQLAEGTGVRIGGALDPVGATMEPGPTLYSDLLTGTAGTLAECLGQ
ncbi:zinc ABC transporter substrate-binding protein [Neotabrizicola sp. VNH66]|uniref:zinc ABC transporter substrate-binding protein n=1 Tax=Neotabrizicola sp. VNH66 TaxID=3400918 RepID=UPI003C00544E